MDAVTQRALSYHVVFMSVFLLSSPEIAFQPVTNICSEKNISFTSLVLTKLFH